jgi:peptide subunit release factor 1 (eRF1)
MFTQQDLQALLAFDSGGSPVLSLYLSADMRQESRDVVRLRARGLLKEAGPAHEADAEAIERYLEHTHDWTKPGLAIFSCAPKGFLQVYPTAVAFRNRVRTGKKFHLKPIAHLLDYYAHYGVVLVDQVGARFLEYHLGELQVVGGTMGENIHKVKRGRGSATVGMRGGAEGGREEAEAVQRNIRDTAVATTEFFQRKNIRRLFIGGTAENIAHLREHLPKQFLACLADTFAMDMEASESEIRDTTLALLTKANAKRESQLVQEMITVAAKQGQAVVGLLPTLQAAAAGRIQTLLFSDGYQAPGYQYDSGYLTPELNSAQAEADGTPHEVPDLVELAVEMTLSHGGHVEIISENEALEAAGRIGAVLRY